MDRAEEKRIWDEWSRYWERRSEEQDKWRDYLEHGHIGKLVVSARNLFVNIQDRTQGKLIFYPVKWGGEYGVVNYVFDSKPPKDFPGNVWVALWGMRPEGITALLHRSSDVESSIASRLSHGEEIKRPVLVYDVEISPDVLSENFRKYHRNFGSKYNGLPLQIESAFNHMTQIPARKRKFDVEGIVYPHKFSDIRICGSVA